MYIQSWGEVFTASLQNLWLGFASFVPNLLVAIIIFIVGWVVGSVIGKAIAQVFTALKIDSLFENIGAGDALSKAGFKLSVGGFIGGLVKWFIIVVFLMTSLEIVGLIAVNQFLREVVVSYLPQVIIAALVLILAAVLADAIKKIVTGSAKAVNVRSANMLGSIAYYAIWIFAFIIALNTLGIAAPLIQILFTGIVAMLAIAGGLAFGLGGKDAAGRLVHRLSDDMGNQQ